MTGPTSWVSNRFSVSLLPPEVEPEEKEFVRLLTQALAPSFTLVRRLGSGGMGAVYLARDPVLKRLVAVKILAPSLAGNAEARARFEREAQAVASITHPNVVAVYSVGELANGVPYIVMQYVEGRTLAERIKANGPLDAPSAKRILGEVAAALAAAHRKGVIHRDIKPANILWADDTGRALVTDFGIAAVREHGDGEDTSQITGAGMAIGTPVYMSPEQVLAEPVTDRTDVYSWGLVAYELLTGEGPYQIKSPGEAGAAHLRDVPRPLSSVRADVDAELERLIEECLQKDAAKRPSASEVEERLLHGTSILLEWPPPGLDNLSAKFRRAVNTLGLGSLLVTVPLILLAVFDRESYARRLLPPVEFVLSIATLGLIVFGGGCMRFMKLFRAARDAVDSGYRWGTVAEVAVDRRGDGGALITGAREYATLNEAQRSGVRRRRVVAGALRLAATIVPPVGFVVSALLAARAANGPMIVLGVTVVFSLVLLAAARALTWYENRMLSAARARRTPLSTVEERPEALAQAWTETFEQVRTGQAFGAGRAGKSKSLIRLAIGVTAVAGAGAIMTYGVLLFTTVVSARAERRVARITRVGDAIEHVRGVERLSRYIVPPDAKVTPLRAGEALHSISRAGTRSLAPYERVPAIPIAALSPRDSTIPFEDRIAFGLPEAFRRAQNGFSDRQRLYLEHMANNPALPLFAAVARAPGLDLGSAMWLIPPGTYPRWSDLPRLRPMEIRRAARSNMARAALELSDGRTSDAERRLREVISVGFLLLREGRTVDENYIGANLIRSGRLSFEAFLQATGRRDEARFVSQSSDPTIELQAEPDESPASFEETMRAVPRTILDTTALLGERWSLLVGSYALDPCADLRQLIFGADSSHRATLEQVRRTMVRRGSDSLLFSLASGEPGMLRACLRGF